MGELRYGVDNYNDIRSLSPKYLSEDNTASVRKYVRSHRSLRPCTSPFAAFSCRTNWSTNQVIVVYSLTTLSCKINQRKNVDDDGTVALGARASTAVCSLV